MQGESALSNSSLADHRRRTVTTGSRLKFNGTEPQSLHDVDKDLWQQSFESIMAKTHDHSLALSLSSLQYDYCSSSFDSGSLPHPMQTPAFSSQDTINQYGFASPAEPATTDAGPQSSPNQDATPTQVQSPRRSGSRPFSCPDCHTYTTDRKFILNRHRETRHGKGRSSD
ncbi:hypothetical protein H9Q74_002935 [Fusarium xylarioides]|nr:hypothetical protein H9Q71_002863 [Fusarium xylarioides]KAG5826976.1 hypothetical protein H9Q74_002935 [Fusarium xylarioides]